MSSPTITCIYCKTIQPRPKRGEHIVLDCLGGKTCIQDVCTQCNTGVLSQLDQEFARNSLIVLHRLFNFGPVGQAQDPQFIPRPTMGGFLDVTVHTSPLRLSTPHQAFLLDNKLTTHARADVAHQWPAIFEGFEQALATNSKRLHRSVRDIAEHVPARLVARPKNSKWDFALRARTETELEELLKALADWRRLQDPTTTRRVDEPLTSSQVDLRLSIDLDVPGRCVAKMAFNFLSHHLGPELALRFEFDEVRDYITGRNVLPVLEAEGPDGEIGLTVDTRFVSTWDRERKAAPLPWVFPHGHTVVLTRLGRDFRASVHLFGGMEHFTILLGTLPDNVSLRARLPRIVYASMNSGTDDIFFDEDDIPNAS